MATIEVGARVRVKESVVVYHHPEHRNEAFDVKGKEGEVLEILTDWNGRPVSANLPVNVLFFVGKKKFRAHFRPEELEILS
ncbi:Ferredoxin-thioredoxin reductase variable chain [Geitlerinema sp. FC II]|nr:ferredoxin-thioredoxin reductase variable chain [Geitlerinema sp. CS-897]PPT11227.1 Ferredoxin-thioredoxin reductase variable chain [Geitlerinema sp. FC II]